MSSSAPKVVRMVRRLGPQGFMWIPDVPIDTTVEYVYDEEPENKSDPSFRLLSVCVTQEEGPDSPVSDAEDTPAPADAAPPAAPAAPVVATDSVSSAEASRARAAYKTETLAKRKFEEEQHLWDEFKQLNDGVARLARRAKRMREAMSCSLFSGSVHVEYLEKVAALQQPVFAAVTPLKEPILDWCSYVKDAFVCDEQVSFDSESESETDNE